LETYRVTITPRRPEGIVPMIPARQPRKKPSSVIPTKYQNLQSSDLTAVVKATAARSTSICSCLKTFVPHTRLPTIKNVGVF